MKSTADSGPLPVPLQLPDARGEQGDGVSVGGTGVLVAGGGGGKVGRGSGVAVAGGATATNCAAS